MACSLRVHQGSITEDMRKLRETVYCGEKGYLSADRLETKEDLLGSHVLVYFEEKLAATVQVYPAESGEFAEATSLPSALLQKGVFVTRCMVDPKFRGFGFFRLALYYALSLGRSWGRSRLFCLVEEGDIAAIRLVDYQRIDSIPNYRITGFHGKIFSLIPATQSLSKAMLICFSGISDDHTRIALSNAEAEIRAQLDRRIHSFLNQSKWVGKVRQNALSKREYMTSLENMYGFVRLTTRIIATAVSLTSDKKLRHHFLKHLQGEVDHEVQIEADLRYLGYDVDYLRDQHITNPATQKFMVIQEALLGYYKDSKTYLAVPFA